MSLFSRDLLSLYNVTIESSAYTEYYDLVVTYEPKILGIAQSDIKVVVQEDANSKL